VRSTLRRLTAALGLVVALGCGVAVSSADVRVQQPCPLTAHFASHSGKPPDQQHVNVVLVDDDTTLRQQCRILGFPDVELIGSPERTSGAIYYLPRTDQASTAVTLRPGQSAHVVVTWLPWGPGNSGRWTPGYLRIVLRTSRGESVPIALPWRFGTVLRQDGATHPGTYVGPVMPGPG
jgi:hypothetical protein